MNLVDDALELLRGRANSADGRAVPQVCGIGKYD